MGGGREFEHSRRAPWPPPPLPPEAAGQGSPELPRPQQAASCFWERRRPDSSVSATWDRSAGMAKAPGMGPQPGHAPPL